MLLPTKLTNRRQFLERSMLGFGSAFVLPSLLSSCTDHLIPDPKPNPTLEPPRVPSADAYSVDWNDAAKSAVSTALGMVPEAGDILSSLNDIFWPTDQPSVWDQIKTQVEQLVDQKIADNVYQQVSDDLKGLNGVLQLYLDAVNDDDPNHIYTNWANLRYTFVDNLPHFQEAGYEFLLLPLYAQFTNMYLTVLQDPLLPALDPNGNPTMTGKNWNMNDKELADVGNHLLDFITAATKYTTNTFLTQRTLQVKNVQFDANNCEPLKTKNRFDRSVTRTTLDYIDLWQYYDYTKYPLANPVAVVFTREIYSDPYGFISEDHQITDMPPQWATQLPTRVLIIGGHSNDHILAVQVNYPGNTGPSYQSSTYGGLNGNGSSIIDDLNKLTPNNPIVFPIATYDGTGVVSFEFRYANGYTTGRIGGKYGYGNNDSSYDGFITIGSPWKEAMSSLLINTWDDNKDTADLVVFGTQRWQSPAAALDAVRSHYVKSPKERSAAEYAKAFPKLGITAGLITDALKLARKAYWDKLKARAAKLK